MTVINAYLIDRSRLFREGLKRFLIDSPFEVIGEATEILEGLADINSGVSPDIIIVDFFESDHRELDAVRQLREAAADAKIVLLAGDVSPTKLNQALEVGIDACLVKNISSEALVQYLGLVIAGEKVFPVELAKMLIEGKTDFAGPGRRSHPSGLSPRELEILGCLINGDPNKVIANRLRITEATVKVHLKGLLKKINAANRTQAAMWAVQNGIERFYSLDRRH